MAIAFFATFFFANCATTYGDSVCTVCTIRFHILHCTAGGMKIRDREFGCCTAGGERISGSGTIYEEWNLIRLARAGDTGTGN